MRGVVMLPVSVHWPVDALYSSALARKPSVFSPPTTSTCPLGSSVAVWPALAVFRLPVTVQVAEVCATAGEAVTARRPIATTTAKAGVGAAPAPFRLVGIT